MRHAFQDDLCEDLAWAAGRFALVYTGAIGLPCSGPGFTDMLLV